MTDTTFYIDPKRYGGRPVRKTGAEQGADPKDRTELELSCYDLLDSLGIFYQRVDHSAADTIEACQAVEQVLGCPICKNLFLCNRQKTEFYLLLMEGQKPFHTKDLSRQLGVSRLSFAGPEEMQQLLGVRPGSVTVLALKNDIEKRVHLVLDRPIAEAAQIACHPCISTSTVTFATKDLLERLLPALEYEPVIVELPEEEEAL